MFSEIIQKLTSILVEEEPLLPIVKETTVTVSTPKPRYPSLFENHGAKAPFIPQ